MVPLACVATSGVHVTTELANHFTVDFKIRVHGLMYKILLLRTLLLLPLGSTQIKMLLHA